MNIVIIEDEPLVAKDLIRLVNKVVPDAHILKVLESVYGSIEYFQKNPSPDLILSDIQLSDGISFDIFTKVNLSTPIIFTTAYNEFAIKAFKLNSIDYLLKPIDEDELFKSIEKFKRLSAGFNKDVLKDQINSLLEHLKHPEEKKYKTRFTGHLGKSMVAVPGDHVACFTKDVLIFIITSDNKHISTDYQSLEELETHLNPTVFFRANRQYIVNINAIDNIKTHFTGKLQIQLKSPVEADITVSREKASEFRKWFEGN
jgi:two-component system, LytTR family, response regulator